MHKRFSSLMTAGAALAAPAQFIAPVPVFTESTLEPATPVAPVNVGYLPRPGCAAHRVCMKLLQHPSQRYTPADVAQRFSVNKELVKDLLARCVEVGLLQRHRDNAEVLYSAGPHIARVQANLSTIEIKEPTMAVIIQIPVKTEKQNRVAEDFSTPYKPQTVMREKLPEIVKPARAISNYANPASLEICDDPLPALPGLKYQAVFDKLQPGQCIKCAPADTGKISGGLRKHFERNNITDKVKTTNCYEADGLGRVWWVSLAQTNRHENSTP
jgi:hypothetical protein